MPLLHSARSSVSALRRAFLSPRVGLAVAVTLLLSALLSPVPPASAAPARINGSGSTYVALAMQQWVADAQTNGLQVNYLPTGSPDGLQSYANGLIDFAGTEAEFSALSVGGGTDVGLGRGYQYVPSTAGAIAVMYNVDDRAGRKVDYLRLSRRTVARIFTGDISNWSDPAITDDNNGLQLPDQQIQVVYRGGQSGTTALFYDFVANVARDVFTPWAQRNNLPTNVRIIQLDSTPNFAPKTLALNGSDQIAQFTASAAGKWSIAYDEFGYAKTYRVSTARVQNAAGEWVLPFADNISSALVDATLRPDLSQELSGVYNSGRADAYPLSAYSYIVTQCAPSPDRPTCKGPYPNPGTAETLARWLRYIACEGQTNMARIGYSPLPPNLSQEVANSIGRMTGSAPEQLNAGNCANPRFTSDRTGSGSPPDPLENVDFRGGAGGGGGGGGGSTGGGTQAAAGGAAAGGGTTAGGGEVAAGATTDAATSDASGGRDVSQQAVGGGSGSWRRAAPVVYDRPPLPGGSTWPLVVLLGLVTLPFVISNLRRHRRSDAASD